MGSGGLKRTDRDALEAAAECLRTLAHPHRLRIVRMLPQGDYTVGELAVAGQLARAMASEHLR
jgi:DNA-binding transcriptional ArsR family regulator